MNSIVGTLPPSPPERTADRCQSEVLRLAGDLMAEAGSPHPNPEAVSEIHLQIGGAIRRWVSAHHLIHAAERKEKAS